MQCSHRRWCLQNGLVDALEFLTTFALTSGQSFEEKIHCACLLWRAILLPNTR